MRAIRSNLLRRVERIAAADGRALRDRLDAYCGSPCGGAPWGRGCLYLTGGLLQRIRGPTGSTGTAYLLRHSYNQCVLQGGPPQFPSSGGFSKQRVVEMDGANFDPVTWFANYQS